MHDTLEKINFDLSLTAESRPNCEARSRECLNEAVWLFVYETACKHGDTQAVCNACKEYFLNNMYPYIEIWCTGCDESVGRLLRIERL